ncbi:hypothetical protein LEP1GSC047_2844 [Leptospira inadai serovar Lyme str. 10]|uniref:Uncharacterized protein n=2 Tax=Leptospira inadai serovar Lyme TaxID=293084 RepID=V6HAN6_9LEPT|nr:hypothetical protein LEP1GSC047_2844 [Leptospira inadai serovar Lyme str. 10]PNV76384.1 hypothetical protein BES34_001915 [Leptospira inadai serovar Lyme]
MSRSDPRFRSYSKNSHPDQKTLVNVCFLHQTARNGGQRDGYFDLYPYPRSKPTNYRRPLSSFDTGVLRWPPFYYSVKYHMHSGIIRIPSDHTEGSGCLKVRERRISTNTVYAKSS